MRGGNPVLFPSLPANGGGDRWSRDGHQGELKQHGFARQLAWDIISTGTDEGASATLGLSSNDQTLAQYPWNFDAEYRYLLRGLVLRIEMRFTNRALTPMPFGAGFHPYFHVRQSEKGSTRIQTSATRAFDNAAQQNIALPRIDLDRARGRPSFDRPRLVDLRGDDPACHDCSSRFERVHPMGWRGNSPAKTPCASSRGPHRATRSTPESTCYFFPLERRAPSLWKSNESPKPSSSPLRSGGGESTGQVAKTGKVLYVPNVALPPLGVLAVASSPEGATRLPAATPSPRRAINCLCLSPRGPRGEKDPRPAR